ncbi:NADH dehydrogenase [ubiquinone] 1 alpha subcomplex subunit 6 [Echinococcus granulosus]|uniref:NADH dehydrogenase [ubiquinone] 1 alpha subcomplex subunit 6 n=1 Tax=Echinococcus granulosus TaxID=6210 RepID=W6UQU3_ECHGR|nr:NADH dehydrogenase [ubiquinone] 1 alpha subcomplex subunit [Echinococcus granulosus]EUB63071.1 NADH dehydrogenase [ubiquinone] 1 alpha subcomplex subunit [Echinococcus granulosus]KAH9282565.1 NADH dehydrogenase [ubiquinone] 1 alpha subcomplex subunit 6 [Echinococcus granulosus]
MSASGGFKVVRPILSRTPVEAKRRVLNLYRAWYRQLPFIIKEYGFTYVTATLPQLKQKLREEFMKNKDVKDIRVVDLLVHRGQNDLLEVAHLWRSDCQVMDVFRETAVEKPRDFLAKFLSGQ